MVPAVVRLTVEHDVVSSSASSFQLPASASSLLPASTPTGTGSCQLIGSLAEYRGADADKRGPLFDRRLEIVTHAHRQMREHAGGTPSASHPSRSSRSREPGACLFLISCHGGISISPISRTA